jgi:hypothetical protein
VSKPYDAASKELLHLDPVAWAGFVGVVRPPQRIELTDSELSSVTAAADKVLVIRDEVSWILDIEFQSWRDPGAPRQLLRYNALLQDRHTCPVASVQVVLAEHAFSPAYSGRYLVAPPFGPSWEFGYTVIKVWEASVSDLLAGPLALAPLATIADVPFDSIPEVIREVAVRAHRESDPATTDRLITAIGLLLRLRYGPMTASDLLSRFPEIPEMEPFKQFTDKGLIEGRDEGRDKGLIEGLQLSVEILGRERFGEPQAEQVAGLKSILETDRLERLLKKALTVRSWEELLAGA